MQRVFSVRRWHGDQDHGTRIVPVVTVYTGHRVRRVRTEDDTAPTRWHQPLPGPVFFPVIPPPAAPELRMYLCAYIRAYCQWRSRQWSRNPAE